MAYAETRGSQGRDALRDAGLRPRQHAVPGLQDIEGPFPQDHGKDEVACSNSALF